MSEQIKRSEGRPRRLLGTLGAAVGLAVSLVGAVFASGNNSTVTLLQSTDGKAVYGQAISRSGLNVTGVIDNASHDAQGNEVYKAFRLVNGTATVIPVPGSTDPTLTSFGEGVNDAGDVVGEFTGSDSPYPKAFLAHGTTVTDLNAVLGANFSQARAINNNGVIAGFASWPDMYGGFILKADQTVIRIPHVYISAMNSANHVVGVLSDTNGTHPVYFADANNDGQVQTDELHVLGTLGGADTLSTSNGPLDINDSDVIVGSLLPANSTVQHPITWANGNAATAATDLLPTATVSSVVFGINNSGHMVGLANGSPFYSANGSLQDANLISLSRIVSEGQIVKGVPPDYMVYSAHKISNADDIVAEVAPHQVPPAVGAIISINGNSTPPPPASSKAKTLKAPKSVVAGDPIHVTVALDKKTTTAMDGEVHFVVGVLNTAYGIHFAANSSSAALDIPTTDFRTSTSTVSARISASAGGASTSSLTVSILPIQLSAAKFTVTQATQSAPGKVSVALTFTGDLPDAGVDVVFNGLFVSNKTVHVYPTTTDKSQATAELSTSEVTGTISGTMTVTYGAKTVKSPKLTITSSTPPAPLALADASITPSVISNSTAPASIKVSVTFNQPLKKGQKVDVKLTVTGPLPLPVNTKVSIVGQANVSTYDKTAADVPNFGLLLSQAPSGDYTVVASYGNGSKTLHFTIQ